MHTRVLVACRFALALLMLLAASPFAFGQRAGAASVKQEGKPAVVVYRQDFEDEGMLDSFYKTISHGVHADWCSDPAGAFGGKGSLKISSAGGNMGAERYLDWKNDNTTIAFMYYAHGVKSPYLMGHGAKAGKNLHAYFPVSAQDKWQFARVKASSFSGFGGGNSSPGETFRNLLFVVEEWDKDVKDPFLLIDRIVVFSGDDGQAPTAPPTKLAVTWFEKTHAASINFTEAVDDVGVFNYEVHRSLTPGFEPGRETRLARINDSYFEDGTVEAGKTYYYKIVAEDAGGFRVASEEFKYVSEKDGQNAAKARGG
jgi:hypothetical protein